jgi:Fe-S-cluster containining protein
MEARENDVVVVRGSGELRRVPFDRVYFAFSSGRFRYDCVSCNATCCRGYGYRLQAGRELEIQIQARPAVVMFMDKTEEGLAYHVNNCPPQCFFLDGTNRCGIQVRSGYDAKPETCRLFPFNHFRFVGDYLIVSPHQQLCPLEVVLPPESSRQSSHAILFEDMKRGGISGSVAVHQAPVNDISALISLERAIEGISEEALTKGFTYTAFAAAQLAATMSFFADAEPRSCVEGGDAVMCDVAQLMHLVLGTHRSEAAMDTTLRSVVIACTPALRSHLLFPDRASDGCGEIARIPLLLLALHELTGLAHDAGAARITYQTVLRLFRDYLPLLSVLALVNTPVVWHPSAEINLAFEGNSDGQHRFARLVKALLPARQLRKQPRLGEVLCDCAPQGPVDRSLFLKRVARRLAGRLAPAAALSRRRRRQSLWPLRPALRRWALAVAPCDAVVAAGHREIRAPLHID